ncbi:MAG: hypothetical protein V6Z86_05660 [Hyphomicrobiales bacterium]
MKGNTVKVEFNLHLVSRNEVFQSCPRDEIVRILDGVALSMRQRRFSGSLRDINGNSIGQWSYVETHEDMFENWQEAVAGGETKLGYEAWKETQ